MFGNIFDLYRTESPQPDVKSDFRDLDSHIADGVQKLGSEVKTCGRSCGRTGLLSIYSLISVLVFELFVNIWRKRHCACFIQDLFPDSAKVETDDTVAVFQDFFALGFEFSGKECHSFSGTDLLAGTGKCLPVVLVDTLQKKKFDGCARVAS